MSSEIKSELRLKLLSNQDAQGSSSDLLVNEHSNLALALITDHARSSTDYQCARRVLKGTAIISPSSKVPFIPISLKIPYVGPFVAIANSICFFGLEYTDYITNKLTA